MRASDANGIVVITQLSPIGVVFPIPEDALPRVMKRLKAGDRIPVDAFDRAQKEKLGTGRLLTADNQIDTATGTIKLKAEFANADGTLFANQFVNVRMPVETRPNATLAPTAAIQRGAQGTFVYVVKDDQTVAVTPVVVGTTQGETTSIDSGVAPGAMVVVDGADRLREGAKVEVVTRDAPVPTAPEAARKGKRGDKDGADASSGRPRRACEGWRLERLAAGAPHHESVAPVHPPAGGDLAADGRDPARRHRRVSRAAGVRAAQVRLSDHPGRHAVPRRALPA